MSERTYVETELRKMADQFSGAVVYEARFAQWERVCYRAADMVSRAGRLEHENELLRAANSDVKRIAEERNEARRIAGDLRDLIRLSAPAPFPWECEESSGGRQTGRKDPRYTTTLCPHCGQASRHVTSYHETRPPLPPETT